MHVTDKLRCLKVTVVMLTEILQLVGELVPQFGDELIETLFGDLGGRVTFSFQGRDPVEGRSMLLRDRSHSLGVHFNEPLPRSIPAPVEVKITSPSEHALRRDEWRGRCALQQSSTKAR